MARDERRRRLDRPVAVRGVDGQIAATYSTTVGSPVGDTTGGTFRFTCTSAPCKVSATADVLSNATGVAHVYPRILIQSENPQAFCEYADGADNSSDADSISRVAMSTSPSTFGALDLGIGGSLDCNAGQTYPAGGVVQEIWCRPALCAASNPRLQSSWTNKSARRKPSRSAPRDRDSARAARGRRLR